MNLVTWSQLHLGVMETVQNKIENEEVNAEDLATIEAKKMWWHAILECGVVELYSQQALEWYQCIIYNSGKNVRPWTSREKPEPRLKVWIKPQFSHLSPEKYIELCLKFHPKIKNKPWKLESTTEEEGNRKTAYIRASQELLSYIQL